MAFSYGKRVRDGLLAAVLAAAPLNAQITWTDWTGYQSNPAPVGGYSVFGQMVLGSTTVGVKYTGPLVGLNLGGGFNYWNSPSTPYTQNGLNAPTTSDILQITGGTPATMHKIEFSTALSNVFFAVLSLGQPGYAVRYDFDRAFTIASQGTGYWGGSSTSLYQQPGDVLVGTEGHGTLRFGGNNITSISWSASPNEYWHGFTVGGDALATSTVPEPGTITLLGTGLAGVLGAYRRRRKREG